jgi:hypothetical protein
MSVVEPRGAQGLTFKFANVEYQLTSVSFNKKVSEVDTSTLKNKHGSFRDYRPAPLRDGDELSVEFYGLETPQMTATAAITFSFDGSGTNAGLTAGLPSAALCTSASLSGSVGDLIKGSATFRLSGPPGT